LKKELLIIGGGSCALFLACNIDTQKYNVTIFEKNPAMGRKFLVAGDGGLNLTHSEPPDKFIRRYTPSQFLEEPFKVFSNYKFIEWLNHVGIQTYVGSSGRVFPVKGIKPITVLNILLEKIIKNNVNIMTRHTLTGMTNNEFIFEVNGKRTFKHFDVAVLCLGGASWPVTGSEGTWTKILASKNIRVEPFEPSNCRFIINWPSDFISKAEGMALKNITVKCGHNIIPGELIITKEGVEGNGIYPLSPCIRQQIHEKGKAMIHLDLKPAISEEILKKRILSLPKKGFSGSLKTKLNLSSSQLYLLKSTLTKDQFLDRDFLATAIKSLQLIITGTGPLEDAISTVGGISLNEIDGNFMLKKIPNVYCIGEMLDYDAPTGGYLLQSCYTMAAWLSEHLNKSA
jgi:uncharacterized flavoprotein (TIGR03862 family)